MQQLHSRTNRGGFRSWGVSATFARLRAIVKVQVWLSAVVGGMAGKR
jgi:hypothetical protein